MIDRVLEWLIEDLTWGGVLAGVLLVAGTAIGSLVAATFWLVTLPSTFFQDSHPRDWGRTRHPALRVVLRIIKNLLGTLLIILGLVLAVPGVPGPGVITLIIGLTLIDFPGKRPLERRIVGQPPVLRAINRLRRRYGRTPLALGNPISRSSPVSRR